MLKELDSGNEEFKNFSLATEYIPDSLQESSRPLLLSPSDT
jgi:hypothetical protein